MFRVWKEPQNAIHWQFRFAPGRRVNIVTGDLRLKLVQRFVTRGCGLDEQKIQIRNQFIFIDRHYLVGTYLNPLKSVGLAWHGVHDGYKTRLPSG